MNYNYLALAVIWLTIGVSVAIQLTKKKDKQDGNF